jgi:hypothetical protein
MRKLYAAILSAASMTAIFVLDFEDGQNLKIVPRFEDGTIQTDVDRSQGRAGLEVQLKGATDDQTKMLLAAHARKVDRNMAELRKYVRCVNDARGLGDFCKIASPK